MIHIDTRSRVPIYEQIQQRVEELILVNVLQKDDQLPSVRSLAVELGINPNTIQKAYTLMEAGGLIYSLPGRGSFIAIAGGDLAQKRLPALFIQFDDALNALIQLSVPKTVILERVESAYSAHGQKGGETDDSTERCK